MAVEGQHIVLLRGLPGSGKSFHAIGWVLEDPTGRLRINYDQLRKKRLNGAPWNREAEHLVKVEAMEMAIQALVEGKSLVIDNTNLPESAYKRWEVLAKQCGVPLQTQFFRTPVAQCKERDALRMQGERVGDAVIDRMALDNKLIEWSDMTAYPYQRFVIVDMDGTLSDSSWRAELYLQYRCHTCDGPIATADELVEKKCIVCGGKLRKDWKRFLEHCHMDKPKWDIVQLVQLIATKCHILIVSGRNLDSCGLKTEDWLRKYKVPYKHLFMRQAGDHRQDTIVKEEILQGLPPLGKIRMVLDDRSSVVAMWRQHGLTCLQAGPGDF